MTKRFCGVTTKRDIFNLKVLSSVLAFLLFEEMFCTPTHSVLLNPYRMFLMVRKGSSPGAFSGAQCHQTIKESAH